MSSIILNIVTPEKKITSDLPVESVVIPGEQGQMTILPDHADLLTSLRPGSFAYKAQGKWTWAFLNDGFAQIHKNTLTVLAETMELAKEIDKARAQRALSNAKEILEKPGSVEYEQATLARERAEARINVLNQ